MVRIRHRLKRFVELESAGGILLILAAILALVINNSPLSFLYDYFLEVPVAVKVGALAIDKPLLLWINDGLMALFFLLIGLEVKRELLEGHLSRPSQVVLPGMAAIGGMLVPAAVFWWFNHHEAEALKGWAIPMATDIAFALGILGLLGSRVPVTLKLFLMTLAIIDDLGAIVVIALFYSADLSNTSLVFAGIFLSTMVLMNRMGVNKLGPYLIIGLFLWVSVLKSGVHATLAGVAMAFIIPLRTTDGSPSPLLLAEHALHPWIAFAIMPIFAFANAGVSLQGLTFASLLDPVPLGIAAGLLIGKTVGVFGFSWLTIKTRMADMPAASNWTQILAVSVLCGIGFTMSLFIGSLAFEPGVNPHAGLDRLGILVGSFFSAVIGYWLMAKSSPAKEQP
ncbi:Na+/H+ antiporter NhaA [Atopomonas sediminilitoris]|uniref:Na+/H+ antiporter NhaA n=1 Tax=Atopomonas sediminilitoris TaxID=2919919 RepID=UPI001F4E7D62|nr:Na+/H+ antiporter NhaA [Atopomonas sediminilitoris]MCJ8168770.1 Na+/H+ antiporter NhaA [Atopomonas sediminilitoris]